MTTIDASESPLQAKSPVLRPTEWLPFAAALAVPIATLVAMAGFWHVLEAQARHRQELADRNAPPNVKLDAAAYARGQKIYAMACVACHGPQGTGVPGLGKNLAASDFARRQSDAQLAAFITAGRGVDDPLNTTKVPMPPKGGRADFDEHNIADIVTFVRGMQDARRVPAGPLPDVEVVIGGAPNTPSPAPATAAPSAATSVVATASSNAVTLAAASNDPQAVARGKKVYVSCMACHGKDATGVKRMGKDLVHSAFVAGLSDDGLLDFIKKGRGPTDPLNTTKVAMPPKGGNPALQDAQLKDVIAYIRSLRQAAGGQPAVTMATPSGAPAAPAAPAPAVSTSIDVEAAARGKKVFLSCMACHGKDATGVKNMGKDLVHSSFALKLSDEELLTFIKKGRGPTDPGNTTKVAMPPKGGNPALKDEQLRDVIAYLRSLQRAAGALGKTD